MARGALADDAVVAAIKKDFVAILMDFDTETVWKDHHGVTVTPMIQWADSTGEVMATTEDVQPAERVLEDIETTLEFVAEFAEDDE